MVDLFQSKDFTSENALAQMNAHAYKVKQTLFKLERAIVPGDVEGFIRAAY